VVWLFRFVLLRDHDRCLPMEKGLMTRRSLFRFLAGVLAGTVLARLPFSGAVYDDGSGVDTGSFPSWRNHAGAYEDRSRQDLECQMSAAYDRWHCRRPRDS